MLDLNGGSWCFHIGRDEYLAVEIGRNVVLVDVGIAGPVPSFQALIIASKYMCCFAQCSCCAHIVVIEIRSLIEIKYQKKGTAEAIIVWGKANISF